MQPFLLNLVLLGLLAAAGVVVIVTIRAKWLRSGDDRGDWENVLAGYKGLRDRGMLSDDEYRKIRTLVEPHVQSLPMAPSRVVPTAEPTEANDPARHSEEQD